MALNLKNHLTDQEKIRIASNFILQSQPKEISEVLNDLRILISDDSILKQVFSNVFSQYNKYQLTPVKTEDFKLDALITDYNDLGSSRFYDPRIQKSFKYDHLRNEVTDFEPWEPNPTTEIHRKALEEAATRYLHDHYKQGTCCVFSHHEDGRITLTVCIESHHFQPKDFWNGKWRSIWSIVFTPTSNVADIEGIIQVQVHYFEDDGNVHLV
ncbi:F-actin-capping protein subunit alpha, partial [Araneus ventricosus]